jgi:hypothetical protein
MFLLLGIIYPVLIIIASEKFFGEQLALFFWKCSIIVGIVSLGFLNSLYSFILEYKKIRIIPTVIVCLIGGIIIGKFYDPNSIVIYNKGNYYGYQFDSFSLFLFLIIEIFLFFYMWFLQIKALPNLLKKKHVRIIAFAIEFTIIIAFNFLYILSQDIIFRDIDFLLLLIGVLTAFYGMVKVPNIFILLTNKIESITIFHKSGILLYSYNFEAREELNESLLKGSILIGINHILSDFVGKKDKLNLLKMKERYIIFDYDNVHGYAVMLISNQINRIIVKAVKQFMQKFTSSNKENLKELTNPKKLIDVSIFHNIKDIIDESFQLFLG